MIKVFVSRFKKSYIKTSLDIEIPMNILWQIQLVKLLVFAVHIPLLSLYFVWTDISVTKPKSRLMYVEPCMGSFHTTYKLQSVAAIWDKCVLLLIEGQNNATGCTYKSRNTGTVFWHLRIKVIWIKILSLMLVRENIGDISPVLYYTKHIS